MAIALLITDRLNKRNLRRERIFRDRSNALDVLDDSDLIERYRFPRQAILDITDKAEQYIRRPTQRSLAIPTYLQVLITLRYFSKGGFLSEIADLHGVSKSSVSLVLTNTTLAILKTQRNVTFPRLAELRAGMRDFYKICGFPRVLGCIDCTHVPIIRPREDEAAYVSRKGYHSINVQAVCDANLRFTNIVVKWPGASHDSYIFNSCALKRSLEEDHKIEGWLLGDSGYACRSYLLTPFLEPSSVSEERFNRAHSGTRNTVERSFGLLKSRFRCLHKSTGCLMFNPTKSCAITTACMQLHNFAINLRLPAPEDAVIQDDVIREADLNTTHHNIDIQGHVVRANLVQNRFSSMSNAFHDTYKD